MARGWARKWKALVSDFHANPRLLMTHSKLTNLRSAARSNDRTSPHTISGGREAFLITERSTSRPSITSPVNAIFIAFWLRSQASAHDGLCASWRGGFHAWLKANTVIERV